MFLKYIKDYLTPKISSKAEEIFSASEVQLSLLNEQEGTAELKVKSANAFSSRDYIVKITGWTSGGIKTSCTCDFYLSYGPCKHIGASLLKLNTSLSLTSGDFTAQSGMSTSLKDGAFVFSSDIFEKYPINTQRDIAAIFNHHLIGGLNVNARRKVPSLIDKIMWTENRPDYLSFELHEPFETNYLKIKDYDKSGGKITCTCGKSGLCEHRAALIFRLQKENNFGLLSIQSQDLSKGIEHFLLDNRLPISEKLIARVQKTLNIKGQYSYSFQDDQINQLLQLGSLIGSENDEPNVDSVQIDEKFEMQYVLAIEPEGPLNYTLSARIGKLKRNGEISKTAQIFNEEYLAESFLDLEWDLDSLKQAVKLNQLYELISTTSKIELDDLSITTPQKNKYAKNLNDLYKRLLPMLRSLHEQPINLFYDKPVFSANKFNFPNQIEFQTELAKLSIDITKKEDTIVIEQKVVIGDTEYHIDEFFLLGYGLLLINTKVYHLSPSDAHTLNQLKSSLLTLSTEDYQIFEKVIVNPLLKKHEVNFINLPEPEIFQPESGPRLKLYLHELQNLLSITPNFEYNYVGYNTEVGNSFAKLFAQKNAIGEEILVQRDKVLEQELLENLYEIHPDFEYQRGEESLLLPAEKVLKNNWFFHAFDTWRMQGIEVLGFKELKKLKYNPNRPQLSIKAGSGIDWFELEINLYFGEEKVSLAELRKAIRKGDTYIRLGDGSIGILPQDWIDKYAHLLKTGKIKGDKLSFNGSQFGVIDQLYDEINDNEKLVAFHDKLQKLKNYQVKTDLIVSPNLKAQLRDYQQDGFRWMYFLQQTGWGGCLADDMGLGKTVQAISLIQTMVDENPNAKILVVVPTSLIFNWDIELKKFSTGLNVLNHIGSTRSKNHKQLEKYHVILTTYGLVRQDISWLKEYQFNTIILDESQAIKNPDALVAKAVKLLKAEQRFVMTGTPIENNTFDLYSQFDFINPGMLGSIDSFRENYAMPIDKMRDENAAKQLRKLIYPFMLSRKKEQVAKELPPKTETVIYCEMGPAQRKVYDDVRNQIKEDLKKQLETEGAGKAGMMVFQGLMRLRQVCNSPVLLNNPEILVHDSVKMQVLLDNLHALVAEGHKVLVFSFFVQMLELVGKNLEHKEIDYAWISGSTTDRQGAVNKFKTEESCKVFLISLKAGGFGLNLTEADYVYLIDPWWNPAVEQQAIDRVHRIGQDKHIFAYKLVCRNTIEEKILELQEKKKSVANELINIEQGSINKMDKNEILALFE